MKLSIHRTFIYLSVLAVCVAAFAKLDSSIGSNYSELESYKAMLGEIYDTTDEVCVRSCSREEPLWSGEPEGYYLYTGYVGPHMTDGDLKRIVVLDTGPVAKEAFGVIGRCRDNIWRDTLLEVLVLISGIGLVFYAVKDFYKRHREDFAVI